MVRRDLEDSAEVHFRDRGYYALSAWSFAGRTPDEIARAVGTDSLPHARMRASTVGRLRANGFEVDKSEPPPGHVDIRLDGPLSDTSAVALEASFGAPLRNP